MERLTAKNINTGLPCLKGEVEFVALSKDCIPLLQEGITKLSQYEDAEEQGLLHKAPVPDGTKIFIIWNEELEELFWCIYEPISEASYYHGYTEYVFGELGTGFFLTKEAAEAALTGQEVDK